MLSRFILMFVLAKLLSPTELGLFGLMLASISFCVLLVGADFYTYSQRELLALVPEKWSYVVQQQIYAQLILYLIFSLPLVLIFFFDLLNWQYAMWFFLLLLIEHISQEMIRLLIAMQKQVVASIVLFFRMGFWVIFALPLMAINSELNNLDTIFISWFLGGVISIIIGTFYITKAIPIWVKVSMDINWIKKGFKVGGLFLLATLCFRGLLTFDRYAVEYLANPEMVGVYFFYIGIILGTYNFLEPAVFSFLYPRMLQAHHSLDIKKFNKVLLELKISTVLISVVLGITIYVLTPIAINWVGKAVYEQYLPHLYIFILIGLVYAIGHIPHYALYAMKGDKWIIIAHVSSLLIFFVAILGLNSLDPIKSVSIALLISLLWIGFVKTSGYYFYRQNFNKLRSQTAS